MSAGDQWGDTGPKSGGNTAVAVLNFVLGGLSLVCGIITFVLTAGAAAVSRDLPGLAGFLASILAILAFVYLLIGAGGIAAGVGVINRRSWGRILSFVLGGICILLAILNLVSVFVGNLPGLVGVIIFGGYAITTFVVLLNPVNAREFH